MSVVDFPYIDVEIERMVQGGPPSDYLRHFHWGLYDTPDVTDDSSERYLEAAKRMTEHVLAACGVADGRRVLDVGCGFGGTLDLVRSRYPACRSVGLNIDERQLVWGRRIIGDGGADGTDEAHEVGGVARTPVAFVAGDGCRLPVGDASVDHVLAVECVFHFPSRKMFFREAARVLPPGGTLALSDFVVASGRLAEVGASAEALGLGPWYGRSATPLTPEAYERMGRGTGFELIVDDDLTPRTLPTYAALRRLYDVQDWAEGVATIDAIRGLAAGGGWQYHVLAFRRREGRSR